MKIDKHVILAVTVEFSCVVLLIQEQLHQFLPECVIPL